MYIPGGYHPVCLGDTLHERYRIVHKLGYGSFSTVWLARDDVDATYKAIKLMISSSSATSHEPVILRHLSNNPTKISQALLPTLLDEFTISGPNGEHRSLVTEVAGCSLARSTNSSPVNFFTMEAARAITTQVILAIQFIHSRGVAHGDLHTGNILLSLPKVDGLTVNELYKRIGEPTTQLVELRNGEPLGSGYPPYEVDSANVFVSCKMVTPTTCGIRLCDFGEAYFAQDKARFDSHTPVALAPPETMIEPRDKPLGLSSDIWTLACTLFEIFSNQPLFDDGVADIVNGLGGRNLPRSWQDRWTDRHTYIDNEGVWKYEGYDPLPLAKRVEEIRRRAPDNFTATERGLFVGMLESMLKFRPEDRATAEEIVDSRWMREWGLPSLQNNVVFRSN